MFVLAAALTLSAPVPRPSPDWVTVRGWVVWPSEVDPPERKAVDLSWGSDAEYAGRGGPPTDDTFVVSKGNRGLKDVVVWLRPDTADEDSAIPADQVHPQLAKAKPATHTLTSTFCRFDKRVVALRAGDTLEVVNKGDVDCRFNCHAAGAAVAQVELKRGGEAARYEGLKASSSSSGFSDPAHPWAKGRVRVFDHPYFAVTDEDGKFELRQVPKGKWRLVYWHESGYHTGKPGRLGVPVEVKAGDKGEMEVKPLTFEVPK